MCVCLYALSFSFSHALSLSLADDNQICDANLFHHNSSEPKFVAALALAKQLGVKLSYFQFATAFHYCTHPEMVPGQGLAQLLVNQTGGVYFFGVDEYANDADFVAQVLPALIKAGRFPVCPVVCPRGFFYANGRCNPINPCDVQPCKNGATCVPSLYTTSYQCLCQNGTYGARCQFNCVPHSFPNNVSHALGMVVDTSDSTAFAINSIKAAIDDLLAVAGSFDQYYLSTWAYQFPNFVKNFPTISWLQLELSDPEVAKNKRIDEDTGLAQHDDWKYMVESVEAMLPMMGDHGVLVILTDFEAVCDANPAARIYQGVVRYPNNPLSAKIASLNTYAKAHDIKIFFFTFPSSDYGWCNETQKTDVGLPAEAQLVSMTGGLVGPVPAYYSPTNIDYVKQQLVKIVDCQGMVQRCECPSPYQLQDNVCVL